MTTTTHADFGRIPELTLGWRLRMARELTGMGLREFADHIGVSPDTLTSAERDRRKVRPITINAYALATGVDRDWLTNGSAPVQPEPDGDLPLLPRLDSNQQPSGYRHTAPVVPLDERRRWTESVAA